MLRHCVCTPCPTCWELENLSSWELWPVGSPYRISSERSASRGRGRRVQLAGCKSWSVSPASLLKVKEKWHFILKSECITMFIMRISIMTVYITHLNVKKILSINLFWLYTQQVPSLSIAVSLAVWASVSCLNSLILRCRWCLFVFLSFFFCWFGFKTNLAKG